MEQIEIIKNNNFNRKIKNELDYLKGTNNLTMFMNLQDNDITDRIKLLENLLNIPIKEQMNVQQQRDKMNSEMSKYIYKKQWNKLQPIHKITKLKEYILEHVKSNTMQEEIIEKITKHISNGMVNTKKYVIYDPNAEKILSLPCLIIDEASNTYQLKIV